MKKAANDYLPLPHCRPISINHMNQPTTNLPILPEDSAVSAAACAARCTHDRSGKSCASAKWWRMQLLWYHWGGGFSAWKEESTLRDVTVRVLLIYIYIFSVTVNIYQNWIYDVLWDWWKHTSQIVGQQKIENSCLFDDILLRWSIFLARVFSSVLWWDLHHVDTIYLDIQPW